MGREVRRVPADWEHPDSENHDGKQPLYDQCYAEACQEWVDNCLAWNDKTHPDQQDDGVFDKTMPQWFWDWNGMPPDEAYYRKQCWTEAEATHYQMYECVSEGTPLSPVMDNPENLARWLADNEASAGAYATATYDQWLATIKAGSAPTMVMSPEHGIRSGVEYMGDLERKAE